jgi:hypothetical protein
MVCALPTLNSSQPRMEAYLKFQFSFLVDLTFKKLPTSWPFHESSFDY